MARAWHFGGPAHAPQRLPPALRVQVTAQPGRHPGRHFRPRPHAPIRWGLGEGSGQCSALRGRSKPCGPRGTVAAILPPCGPVLVVPPRDDAPPVARIARDRSDLPRGLSVHQHPDALPGAAPHRRFGPAITDGQDINTQLGLDRKVFGPVSILHEDVVSRLGGNMLTRWWRSLGKWRPSSGLLPARCQWCAKFRVPLWFTLRR
jgi:hypothetical protein